MPLLWFVGAVKILNICITSSEPPLVDINPLYFGLIARKQSENQTSLLSYRLARKMKCHCSKLRYGTLQNVDNKGACQTPGMCRLVCACVVRKPPKTGFLTSRPIW